MAQEKNFENRVKRFLKEQGCWFVKYWGGGEFTKAGVPDILCCCCGMFIGIEIKAPNGKPSELQLHNLRKIDETHGFGIMLYPKDFDLFKKFIIGLNDFYGYEWQGFYKTLKERWEGK